MVSILTNSSALIALQCMRSVTQSLSATASEAATGLKVADASDDAATWSVATTIRSDSSLAQQINTDLGGSDATVAAAQNAVQTVSGLLTQLKTDVIAAQTPGIDLDAAQLGINDLVSQIKQAVAGASCNGVNLLDGSVGGASNVVPGSVPVAASVSTDADGAAQVNFINIPSFNLSTSAMGGLVSLAGIQVAPQVVTEPDVYLRGNAEMTGTGVQLTQNVFDQTGDAIYSVPLDTSGGVSATFTYTAGGGSGGVDADATILEFFNGDRLTDPTTLPVGGGGGTSGFIQHEAYLAVGMDAYGNFAGGRSLHRANDAAVRGSSNNVLSFAGIPGGADGTNTVSVTLAPAANGDSILNVAISRDGGVTYKPLFSNLMIDEPLPSKLYFAFGAATGSSEDQHVINSTTVSANGFYYQRQYGLAYTGTPSLQQNLNTIDQLSSLVTQAGAALGEAQDQIGSQRSFLSSLTDRLNTGVGTLVDADMEIVSARLSAEQTQQTLNAQALAIANQQPQSIVALFR